MSPTKEHQSNEDLKTFKEEVIQQFHIISENVIDQVKQVAEGVRNVDEKLERFRKEVKAEMAENHATLSLAIKKVDEKIDNTRLELEVGFSDKLDKTRAEMAENHANLSLAIKKVDEKIDNTRLELEVDFSDKLDKTRAELKADFSDKLDKTRLELKTEIQETRQEILAAVKFSYAELDRRLTTLEKEFLELKHRVDKIEGRSIS